MEMDLRQLEQQRLALEASLEKLRQSLKHWQTWEAEYEGLKEELAFKTEELTANDLEKLAKDYSGELVNEKEILELSGASKASPRTARQIIGLIDRRQDYVRKNIETVQKQYFDAEAKSEELAFAVHGEGGESGLPLTEIHEELDEDGNIISSALSRPEESTSKVIESLRKAGLKDGDIQHETPLKPAITNATPPLTPTPLASIPSKRHLSDDAVGGSTADSVMDDHEHERPSIRKKSVSFTADTKEAVQQPRPESEEGHKRVSFNDKVAIMPAAPPPDPRSVSFSPKVEEIPPQPLGAASPNTQPVEKNDLQKDLRERLKPGERVAELNDDDEIEKIHIVMPENESEEDAKTRREMLEYHLNEVGNVVAQIDLEEAKAAAGADDDYDDDDDDMSFHTSSEYQDDEDTPYTTGLSDSEDEEDEYGRSVKPQITDEYRKRMEELQERLIGNLGPAPKDEDVEDLDPELDPNQMKRLVIRDKRSSTSSMSSDNSEKKAAAGKKRVSFAETLDVAEPASPPLKAQKHVPGENVGPVADTISERNAATAAPPSLPTEVKPPGRLSRFKAARAAAPESAVDDAPAPPKNATLAANLLERTPAPRPPTAPDDEDDEHDEHDEHVQRRQLAEQYYRQRNQMIREQGGFNQPEDDGGEGPLMQESEDGKVRKVSRFKAARLGGGMGA